MSTDPLTGRQPISAPPARGRPRRAVSVLAGTLILLLATAVPARAGIARTLDCPAPSWVKVAQSNSAGQVNHSNAAYSVSPGGTVELHYSQPALRYVSHFGDVRPNTRATFDFYEVNSGTLITSHTTYPARGNGVIHQEPEVTPVSVPPGVVLSIQATFTDECGAGLVSLHLGYLSMLA
ncbi:hypothetical protein Ssi03_03920 [Sphaerisporangium siamense]|uniref:Uncharacterized protein n=1 Tax=Sphaerisporangium siamense TaxID=795645 RepID=A0A7W7GED5_9ACTN|nr:hypothetical protein [Sphaerisporangium siamense]MBB4703931.1 hypothetical protein [Sphaerisporangium siamense]GII82402.1 hypothetical protein Ssi03_03920 [Sphaerisporangium siamense]